MGYSGKDTRPLAMILWFRDIPRVRALSLELSLRGSIVFQLTEILSNQHFSKQHFFRPSPDRNIAYPFPPLMDAAWPADFLQPFVFCRFPAPVVCCIPDVYRNPFKDLPPADLSQFPHCHENSYLGKIKSVGSGVPNCSGKSWLLQR